MDILSNGPASIRDLMAAAGDLVTVLPTLFHLLWSRIISTDLRHRSLSKEPWCRLRRLVSGGHRMLKLGDDSAFHDLSFLSGERVIERRMASSDVRATPAD